jgi:hypothetical protein
VSLAQIDWIFAVAGRVRCVQVIPSGEVSILFCAVLTKLPIWHAQNILVRLCQNATGVVCATAFLDLAKENRTAKGPLSNLKNW